MSNSRDNNRSNSHDSHGSMPQTAEDLRAQYQQNLHSISNIHFDEDEKGNASIMGVSVPKNLKPVIEMGLENLKPFLIDQSDKIFDNTAKLAKRIPFAKAHANKIGVVAENVFRWGIIGAKQIFEVVQASNKYSKERKELFRQFSPVMQATGANIKNNEVLKVAFDDIHSDWVSDMKVMAADLPTLLPMAILGLQDQKRSSEKRKHRLEKEASDAAFASEHHVTDPYELHRLKQKRADVEVEQYKKPWIDEQMAMGTFDHIADEGTRRRELAEHFYSDVAPERRARIMGEHDAHSTPADTDEKKSESMLRWAVPGGTILSQIFKANLEDTAEKRRQRVKAWKMIENLKVEMENQCGKVNTSRSSNGYDDCDRSFTSKPADEIQVAGMGNKEGEHISLKEYIMEVFQQHERDRDPSRSFKDKNGKLIDPLQGTLLTNLKPLVDVIAEHMADGSLSGDALYKLVGENKVIVHGANGSKKFASEAQVRDLIEKDLVPILSTREVMKLEEFMAKFADPALIQETLKKNIQNMKGHEKALFISLFPDDILEQAGMKKSEIRDARTEAHKFVYNFVAASVVNLAAKDPETLKKMGVSDQEIQSIASLAEKIESGDMKAVKTAVDGRDKSVLDAVRTAGLLEQATGGEDGKKFWSERVKEMSAVPAKMTANKRKHDTEESGEMPGLGGGGDFGENSDGKNDSKKKWADSKVEKRERPVFDKKWDSGEPDKDNFTTRLDRDESDKGLLGERVLKKREKNADDPSFTQAV